MESLTLRRTLSLAATLAAVLALAVVGLTPASGAAPRTAPCTKSALTAGLKRGADKVSKGRIVKPYACSGSYAYAAVITHGIEITTVFRAQGTGWVTANRAHACNDHLVPANIYKPACETN